MEMETLKEDAKNRSNYEIYAGKRQKELLEEKISLNQCIDLLKKNKETYSEEYLDNQIDLVASLFGLIPEEIKRVLTGNEYWCV